MAVTITTLGDDTHANIFALIIRSLFNLEYKQHACSSGL